MTGKFRNRWSNHDYNQTLGSRACPNWLETNFEIISAFQEFQNICTNLSTEQIEAAFEKYDISGDDMLDYKEFCGMIHQNEENEEKK